MAADPDRPAGPAPTREELLQIADALLEEAAELRRQWAELERALGRDPNEPGRPAKAAVPPAPRQQPQDPGRLIALEMLLNGRSREEVETFLRGQFGEEPARRVLADLFSD